MRINVLANGLVVDDGAQHATFKDLRSKAPCASDSTLLSLQHSLRSWCFRVRVGSFEQSLHRDFVRACDISKENGMYVFDKRKGSDYISRRVTACRKRTMSS